MMAHKPGIREKTPARKKKGLSRCSAYLSIGVTRKTFDGTPYTLAEIEHTKSGAEKRAAHWRNYNGRLARITPTGSSNFRGYRGKPAYAVWVK